MERREELEVQAMQTRKRVLGEEHPGTLTSMAIIVANVPFTWTLIREVFEVGDFDENVQAWTFHPLIARPQPGGFVADGSMCLSAGQSY